MGNQWLVGAGRGAVLAMNPVGAIWWVATQAAYDGIGPSDNNDGLSPKRPLATIAQAITNCVSGRGDRIVVLPGTYNISAALALTKSAVEIYSLIPQAAVLNSPNTTGAAEILDIDANDITIDGITLTCGNQVTTCIDIADTTASNRVRINNCLLTGSGSAAGATGIRVGDGTNDAADVVIKNCFIDRFHKGITWDGTRVRLEGNTVIMNASASATAINIPARASIAVRSFGRIIDNDLVGSEDGGTKVGVTFATSEAGSPIYVLRGNTFANCASITADIHPEGVGANYKGQATTSVPVLITG